MPRPRRLLALLMILLLIEGCIAPRTGVEILDLWELPQDTAPYLDPAGADAPLWPEQETLAADYRRRFFAPWGQDLPLRPASEAFWIVFWIKGKRLFGENLRPVSPERLEATVASADMASFPSLDLPAITVRPSNLRALPSTRPLFLDPDRAGEGFPFDYLQNSAIAANTPVRIRHRSLDGAWFYVDTAALGGWVPTQDIALADNLFIERFRTDSLAVMVRDEVPVVDHGGTFRFQGRIGTFFPLLKGTERMTVLVAAADVDGRAVIRQADLPAAVAAPFPLHATPRMVAALANRMLGQPYGWGDLYDNRDCSSTLRDLYAPFGLGLPRNSTRQAEAGRFISFENSGPEEKEKRLLENGIPWRTLVWMNGHIMLYIGKYQGRAAVLHAFWGVRTRDGEGRESRRVIGRTVISTLQPGRELPDLALPEGDLRERLRGMTLLGSEFPVSAPQG